ncbi:MAG: plastocyanin/cytochrome c556 [Pirellulaceae bacterium]|jgi:plastocyanin/cytochrome c556
MPIKRHASTFAYCLLGLLVASSVCSDAVGDDWLSPMREFSDAFRQLEKSHKTGEFDRIPFLTTQITKATVELRQQTPRQNAAKARGLEAHATKIDLAAIQLNQAVAANDPLRIASGIETIRHTCVSCHVKFRQFDHLTSFYPARGNTLVVDVNIQTIDGQHRNDNSNVVVFLDRVPHSPTLPQQNPKVSQANRRFYPRVLPIVKGTTVDFPNDDRILHNIFSMSKTKKFDLDVYQPGKSKSVTFPKPGLVKLYCNIHPEMACSILILDNPYFVMTDHSGRGVITGIPDGEFTLRSWHEFGGETRDTLDLTGTSATHTPLQITEKRRSLSHTNKYGKPYTAREKY